MVSRFKKKEKGKGRRRSEMLVRRPKGNDDYSRGRKREDCWFVRLLHFFLVCHVQICGTSVSGMDMMYSLHGGREASHGALRRLRWVMDVSFI